jgi:hypothetical protein
MACNLQQCIAKWSAAPRHSRPRNKSGRETLPALNFGTLPAPKLGTLPAARHFRPWTSPAANLGTIPALRHLRPWDKSGPKTSQDKSGPETFPALRHVRSQDKSGQVQSWDISSPETCSALTFVIKSSDIWLKLLLHKKVEKKPTLNYRKVASRSMSWLVTCPGY